MIEIGKDVGIHTAKPRVVNDLVQGCRYGDVGPDRALFQRLEIQFCATGISVGANPNRFFLLIDGTGNDVDFVAIDRELARERLELLPDALVEALADLRHDVRIEERVFHELR